MIRIVRLLLIALLAGLAAASPAWADTGRPDSVALLPYLCDVSGRCAGGDIPSKLEGRVLHYDLRRAPEIGEGQQFLVTRSFLFDRIELRLRYGDGSQKRVAFDREQARSHWIAGARFALPLPPARSSLTAIDIGADRAFESNLLAEASIANAAAVDQLNRKYLGLFGLFFGVLLVALAYNFVLACILRPGPFQFTYAGMAAAAAAYGVLWSNLIYLVVPSFPFMARYIGTQLLISVICVLNVVFLVQFVEKGLLGRWTRALLAISASATAVIAIAICVFLADVPGWIYRVQSAAYMLVTFAVVAAGAVAWLRGSRYIHYFLASWCALYFAVALRVFRAFDLIDHSYFVDVSAFGAFAVESFIVSFGVAHRVVGLKRERDEAQISALKFRSLAETDDLTGLLDRRAFSARIAKRDDQEHALILIDIDHFKRVNDAHGHDGGDRVLRSVSWLISSVTPPGGLCARIGGEEFALLVSGADARQVADDCARALQVAVERNATLTGDGVPVAVTLSIGIAAGPLDANRSWHALYVQADAALYRAKSGGRDRIEWASERPLRGAAA